MARRVVAFARSLRPKPQQLQARRIRMRPVHLPSRLLVREAIAATLGEGGSSLGRTAQALGVSTRSLQRHLADTGTTYSELVTDVRLDAACRLLAGTEERISDIALLLGYTGPSSFSRSFMRLMKIQPVAYRREHREGRVPAVASGPSRLARNGKTPRRHWHKKPRDIPVGERDR
jgi:AraC-like DNA-binding protein